MPVEHYKYSEKFKVIFGHFEWHHQVRCQGIRKYSHDNVKYGTSPCLVKIFYSGTMKTFSQSGVNAKCGLSLK